MKFNWKDKLGVAALSMTAKALDEKKFIKNIDSETEVVHILAEKKTVLQGKTTILDHTLGHHIL